MVGFQFEKLDLQDAYYIKNFYHGDNRGSFTKCFEKDIYAKAGIQFNVNETFVSVSAKNVVRGLHFQTNNPQSKLVSVVHGKAWDVIVDLRFGSKTYKSWVAKTLSAEEHNAMYIPRGFAHGFVALEDEMVMLYQCDGAYDKESDTGIRFDDDEIGIKWPIEAANIVISEKDAKLMMFKEYEKKYSGI